MRFFVHFKREFKQTSISFISLEISCKGEQFGVYLDFKGLNAFEILNRKVYKGRGDRPFESKMVHLVKKFCLVTNSKLELALNTIGKVKT